MFDTGGQHLSEYNFFEDEQVLIPYGEEELTAKT